MGRFPVQNSAPHPEFTLLLTRPHAQSVRFATQFGARFGAAIPVVISPVIEVVQRPLQIESGRFSALVFTSENGVAGFSSQTTQRGQMAYCVGDRTAAAAQAAGFAAQSAGGDLTDLVALVQRNPPVGPLLYARGEMVSGELAGTLILAGIETVEAVVYGQVAQTLTPEALAVLQGAASVLVPLFSPRSARLFQAGAAGGRAPLCIAALSMAVAAAVDLPGQRLETAVRPDADAMLAALARLMADGGMA